MHPKWIAPCAVAVGHQYAAVITEKGLRVNLTTAWLVVEQYNRLVTILAAAVGPHVRRAGGFLVLFLQDLNGRLIAVNERLRSQPQSQRIIDAMQVPLARTDHPVRESAPADRNAGAFERLRHAVERRAVDVFVDECEGQRRGGSDAARQGLGRHRCDYHKAGCNKTIFRPLIEAASSIPTDQPDREFLTFIHNLVSTSFKWTPHAKAHSIAEGAEKFALTINVSGHAGGTSIGRIT